MFSCELCEISENTFLHRAPLLAAFDDIKNNNDEEETDLNPVGKKISIGVMLALHCYANFYWVQVLQRVQGSAKW